MNCSIEVNGTKIGNSRKMKILGITFNNEGNFKDHINGNGLINQLKQRTKRITLPMTEKCSYCV